MVDEVSDTRPLLCKAPLAPFGPHSELVQKEEAVKRLERSGASPEEVAVKQAEVDSLEAQVAEANREVLAHKEEADAEANKHKSEFTKRPEGAKDIRFGTSTGDAAPFARDDSTSADGPEKNTEPGPGDTFP